MASTGPDGARSNSASADVFRFEDLQRTLGAALRKPSERNEDSKQDLPFALELVAKAASALEVIERRLRDTEAWAVSSVKRSREEAAAAEARIAPYEAQLRASE